QVNFFRIKLLFRITPTPYIMKNIVALFVLFAVGWVSCSAQTPADALAGAWHHQEGDREQVIVFVDGYFSHSVFDRKNKTFYSTRGGAYTVNGDQFTVTWQYDTEKADNVPAEEWVGQPTAFGFSTGAALTVDLSGNKTVFQRADKNDAPLAGVWRITGRQQDDGMGEMPLRDRRTLKILTGTRFQWVAINVKTGQFSGTGGG